MVHGQAWEPLNQGLKLARQVLYHLNLSPYFAFSSFR
jgi:hypothetical protein